MSMSGPGADLRVVHLAAGNLYGGVETFLVSLARFQAASSTKSTFALCFEGRLASELRQFGAQVCDLGPVRLSRPWTIGRARAALRTVLERNGADVVVCHGAWPHVAFSATAMRARIPVVYWAHNPLGSEVVDRLAASKPPRLLVANSQFTLSTFNDYFSGCSRTVLRYPVSPQPVHDRNAVRREIRRELQTAESDVVIVCSSRFERWKGHHLLLDALRWLDGIPGWTTWIAGGAQRPKEQAYLDELRRQVATHGLEARVRFVGERRDIPRLLNAADVHCQPNTGPEPFGIAFIEALHAGLPVITSNIGAAREIVTAECGHLVDPDAASVAAALRRLIEDGALRRRLGASGPARAATLCEPQSTIAAIERTLLPLANPARFAHS